MSSFKKAAASGMRFQIESNPSFLYKLVDSGIDDVFTIRCNEEYYAKATFTYKHLVIETSYMGITFKKEVKLSDLNFIP